MKYLIIAFFAAACGVSSASHADTLVYQAITDFPVIDAGEVDYYIETAGQRNFLAINAAQEQNRGKFARATRPFDGAAGSYDVTIATVGEIDGEGEYRFLVNGVIVGSAFNTRVDDDWGLQNHTFDNITIPDGAELAVESIAVTNGLIPEGDITAYARGRWRTLTLESQNLSVPTLDLAVTATLDTANPTVGQTIELTINTTNNDAGNTATTPVVSIIMPSIVQIEAHASCSASGNTVTCDLPEIAANSSVESIIRAVTTDAGSANIEVSASADQQDNIPSNNTATVLLSTQAAVVDNTVDLAVTINSDVNSATTGDQMVFTLTTTNKHNSNTATAPVAGVLLPPSLSFSASSDCSANAQTVLCDLPELPPGQSASAAFSVLANSAGDALILASASSSESEDVVSDNEAQLSVAVSVDPNRTNPTEAAETTDTQGGGGLVGILTLLSLLMTGGFVQTTRSLSIRK